MEKQTGAPLNIPLEGLLEIENGMPYLKCTSGCTGLSRFHRSQNAISKKLSDFLGDNLFGYFKAISSCVTMLGVNVINKDRHLMLSACIGYLPDIATCRYTG